MRRTPNEPTDDTINQLWEGGPILPPHVPTESLANAETCLGKGYVIDLQRHYKFQFRMVGTFRRPLYECIDTITYDPDPDASQHVTGYGENEAEAKTDLLEKLAWLAVHQGQS